MGVEEMEWADRDVYYIYNIFTYIIKGDEVILGTSIFELLFSLHSDFFIEF